MSSAPGGRLARLLHHPRLFTWTLIAAAVLTLPTIAIRFYADDWAMLAYLDHRIPGGRFWDLYTFAPENPAEMRVIQHLGYAPWWTSPDLKLHFFRPLTSATIALDHALF